MASHFSLARPPYCETKAAYNRRFVNMAGLRICSQLLVRYSAVVLIINICNFTQQQLRADDFQMPPHRQAVNVVQKAPLNDILHNLKIF